MSSFLEVALRNAARGFRVHPLVPKNKGPLLTGWPELATTDEATIRQWAEKWPDANCGAVAGEITCVLESDDYQALCKLLGRQLPETFTVQARDNRPHFYFRPTDKTRALGNRDLRGVFELKENNRYVVAEGSIHPTGPEYKVIRDVPLSVFPDWLAERLQEILRVHKAQGKEAEPVEGGRNIYLAQVAGHLRRAGLSREALEAALLQHNEEVCKPPLPDEEVKEIAKSISRYDVPPPEPKVHVGPPPAVLEPAPIQRNRAIYPTEVWDGTVIGEFAKLCAQDNNIPRKLYAEALRCVLGAVVGDRIACPVEGALPRSYTVIIAPKGKGKGTAIRRATRFFGQQWHNLATSPALLSGERDFIWKPQGVGAWNTAASSVPGMARLCKDLEKTVKNSPHLTWGNTLPRILSVHEEMKTFLSTLFIEGGVGSGMEGVICQLWDDVTFNGTATGTREAVYGEMMFSLLAGVTEDDWFDLLSRGNVVGGGLMSRLNLIGTEGGYSNVGRMNPPDFTALQESFLPRVRLLADARTIITPSEAADKIIGEWTDGLSEGTERMNVHAWRNALLLAWLRHEEAISARTAEDAVRLGQYQVESHAYYRVKAAEGQNARVQDKIRRALEMKGPLSKRDLQRYTHASRCGTEAWARALDGLLKDKQICRGEDGRLFRAA